MHDGSADAPHGDLRPAATPSPGRAPSSRRESPGREGGIGLVARAAENPARTAILDPSGVHSYGDLLQDSERVARFLLDHLGSEDLDEAPVAFLVPPGYEWVAVQWGIWRAGGMAVPLAVSHPPRELAYVLDDADPPLVLAHPSLSDRLREPAEERGLPLIPTTDPLPGALRDDRDPTRKDAGGPPPSPGLPRIPGKRGALMLYTSGTTGRPKGVVHTHESLEAQARALTRAWGWSPEDRILLVLPLHHLHGIMNVVFCALWSGASCRVHGGFDARETWERIGAGSLTLFMAVPTIYHRLALLWEEAAPEVQERWSRGGRAVRLMVSGSAALPVTLLEKWHSITGHTLLERYGMTETGMILSNPLHGERRPGHVGQPLPGMEVRLVGDQGRIVSEGVEPVSSEPGGGEAARSEPAGDEPAGSEPTGGVQVRGDTLFREYWRRPEATREAFTEDGWFRTGDVGRLEDGSYRLLGRRSVDILKTGGYKVSALEIESVLLEHPGVAECAVVGIPDPEWGQVVSAALVTPDGRELDPESLRAWAKERLAPYKVPSRILLLEALPRNALGKVQKPRVVELFETD